VVPSGTRTPSSTAATSRLAPFQPSPRKDDGYDISDYYGVDPRFGSSGDFVEFVHEASSRGMRVLMDLVVNHTSDRHTWFRDAREKGSPDCPARHRTPRRVDPYRYRWFRLGGRNTAVTRRRSS
jgi:glycosidase